MTFGRVLSRLSQDFGRLPRFADTLSISQFSLFYVAFLFWRRRGDSNPRDPFEPNGFQDRRFQPLTHSSVLIVNNLAENLLQIW